MILARLQPRESTERRVAPRRQLKLDVAGTLRSVGDIEVAVHDLSATGLLIEAAADLRTSDRLEVEIAGTGAVEAVVVWASGRFFGCEFDRPIAKAALSAAALRSAPRLPPKSEAGRVSQQTFELEPPPKVDFDFSPSGRALQWEQADSNGELSSRRKLLILLGLSVASWSLVALMAWLILALV